MPNFCTLFNYNYLARGLAMYESLERVCESFHLYVFAFDDACYTFLSENPRPNLTVISLNQFEYAALLSIKSTRSMAEYCWTSTPFTILFCLENYALESCTYLDADMIFYQDPTPLITEMGEKSVLISEHRYPKLYDQSWYSGIYCVQFMCFKNTEAGLTVLNWWKDKCIDWCYSYLDKGRFGDQKYLDDWPSRFESVHVMQHPGGGVAPWNLERYDFQQTNAGLQLRFRGRNDWQPLIFFHFHGVRFFTDNTVMLAGPLYPISIMIKDLIYFPYVQLLMQIEKTVTELRPGSNPNGASGKAPQRGAIFKQFLKDRVSSFARHIPGVFGLKNYNFKIHYHLHPVHPIWHTSST